MSGNKKTRPMSDGEVYLRAYCAADAKALSAMTSRDEIYKTTYGIRRDFNLEHARWWIKFNANCRNTGSSYEFGIFECETDQLVGNIGIINVNNSCKHATLAYYVHPDKWGQGIATRAGFIALAYAFGRLHLNRISAVCMDSNTASRRVLEKLGFEFEGIARQEIMKDDKFYDVAHYGLLKEDYFDKPHPNFKNKKTAKGDAK